MDPLNKDDSIFSVPELSEESLNEVLDSLKSVPRYGLHNPFLNKERYLMLGDVSRKASEELQKEEVFNFFVDLMIRAIPRSRKHTAGELAQIRTFFANYSGDNVRFLAEAT